MIDYSAPLKAFLLEIKQFIFIPHIYIEYYCNLQKRLLN